MSVFRDVLLSAIAAGGPATAVVDDLCSVSYDLLDGWSTTVAQETVAPCTSADSDACVALLLPNGAAWTASWLAVLKTGLIAAPLNTTLTDVEVGRVLELSRPQLLLTGPERTDDLADLCATLRLPTLVRAVLPVAQPAQGLPGSFTVSGRHRPGGPCLLMHTSGTTGAPRPVVQTEQALLLAAGHWRRQHRTADDVVAVPVPQSHTYGHLATASTLLAGATLLLSGYPFDPDRWTHAMARNRATVVEAVPAVYGRLLTSLSVVPDATAVLRRCLSAGQSAPAALRDQWEQATGVALWESWGMTELAGPGLGPVDGQICPGSAGLPVPGLEVRVVAGQEAVPDTGADADADCAPSADGATGELWVRGPQVTPGVRMRPGHIDPVTDEAGWLRTGDLARRDAHGCVTLVGRTKDVIVTNGYTVYPAEVEEALCGHPAVAAAAAIPRQDPERGEVVHAVVVRHFGTDLTADDLITHCRTLLARYKTPRSVHFTPALPLSATGKLDRAALRTLAAQIH
ncbi:class I adenylate-forming enzyme family protein [Streptomyces sp. NPDC003038]|uniref:class I adenylate-forming enzyme family protein n=1 Tax=unclassified Streptomyces TaxID=2593676 RepID=UPI0033B828D2